MKSIATCLPPSAQNHNYKHLILIAGFPVAQNLRLGDFFGGWIFMREGIGCRWCVETPTQRKLRYVREFETYVMRNQSK